MIYKRQLRYVILRSCLWQRTGTRRTSNWRIKRDDGFVRLFFRGIMQKEILSKADVAELFGVTETAVNGWIGRHTVPYHKIGERVFFNRRELMALVGEDMTNEQNDTVLEYLLNLVEQRRAELRA